jgi:hypothetical protein
MRNADLFPIIHFKPQADISHSHPSTVNKYVMFQEGKNIPEQTQG